MPNNLTLATCEEDGCFKAVKSRGKCSTHYSRWYRSTKPEDREKVSDRWLAKDGSKICTDCLGLWSVNEFHSSTKTRDGLRYKCKLCTRVQGYGITASFYFELLSDQNNSCAICKTRSPGLTSWCIDHNHQCCPGKRSCGKCVRGLLCPGCNWGIGHFEDSIDRLYQAAEYLRFHKA